MTILELLDKADSELAAFEAQEAADREKYKENGPNRTNEGRAAILYLATIAKCLADIARSKAFR